MTRSGKYEIYCELSKGYRLTSEQTKRVQPEIKKSFSTRRKKINIFLHPCVRGWILYQVTDRTQFHSWRKCQLIKHWIFSLFSVYLLWRYHWKKKNIFSFTKPSRKIAFSLTFLDFLKISKCYPNWRPKHQKTSKS